MGQGTEKLCKFYCFRLSKLYDAAGGLLAVNYNLQEAICIPFQIPWVRQLVYTYISAISTIHIIHVCILMAQRHVFYLWERPKKNDCVKGYDESSPRIFMARPTPSRAASCSPCVHQYKTDNVELMQRHVVQIFLGVKLLVFLTQIICLFFVHIMQYDINWA